MTIVFKNVEAAFAPAGEEDAIKKELFPDQETFNCEEAAAGSRSSRPTGTCRSRTSRWSLDQDGPGGSSAIASNSPARAERHLPDGEIQRIRRERGRSSRSHIEARPRRPVLATLPASGSGDRPIRPSGTGKTYRQVEQPQGKTFPKVSALQGASIGGAPVGSTAVESNPRLPRWAGGCGHRDSWYPDEEVRCTGGRG